GERAHPRALASPHIAALGGAARLRHAHIPAHLLYETVRIVVAMTHPPPGAQDARAPPRQFVAPAFTPGTRSRRHTSRPSPTGSPAASRAAPSRNPASAARAAPARCRPAAPWR